MARPSEFSVEVAAEICSRLVDGKSLRSICRQEDMPCTTTVFVWLQKHPEFAEQYARAREAQADTLADEITDIADDSSQDFYERPTPDGGTERVVDSEHINRSRLRVDARKWVASKLKPRKYGESSRVDHSVTVTLQDLIQKATARD